MALLATSPGQYTLDIYKGQDFSRTFTVRDAGGALVNFTGYTARMKIRPSADSATEIVSLTQADGITLGGAAGTILISRTAAQTAAITQTRGVYDLEVVDGAGLVTRLIEGPVDFHPEVTR